MVAGSPRRHLRDEPGQEPGVGRTGVLPRSKNIEVAQAHGLRKCAASWEISGAQAGRAHEAYDNSMSNRTKHSNAGKSIDQDTAIPEGVRMKSCACAIFERA
jgi:hypothetical protein